MFVLKTKISLISFLYPSNYNYKKVSVNTRILIATGLILPRAYNFTFYIHRIILPTYPVKCKTVTKKKTSAEGDSCSSVLEPLLDKSN